MICHLNQKAKVIWFTGLSGAGKTTLKDRVLPHFPAMKYSISATTRSPREGEVNGEHYFFKTRPEFEAMIEANQLVEWNEVHGNFYGTPKPFIEETLAAGDSLILDLDVFGKVNFDKVFPEAIGILILPPNLGILESRLRDRKTDSEDVIQLRLENSRKEMAFAQNHGKYEFQVINDDLEQAAQELEKILQDQLSA